MSAVFSSTHLLSIKWIFCTETDLQTHQTRGCRWQKDEPGLVLMQEDPCGTDARCWTIRRIFYLCLLSYLVPFFLLFYNCKVSGMAWLIRRYIFFRKSPFFTAPSGNIDSWKHWKNKDIFWNPFIRCARGIHHRNFNQS